MFTQLVGPELEMWLQRVLKVHEDKVDIGYAPNVAVTKKDVALVPEAFLLDNVLTLNECEKFITETERLGYAKVPFTYLSDGDVFKDIRNNLRVMWKVSPEIMTPIWERIRPFIPENIEIGPGKRVWTLNQENPLNERFRFYRYDAKQIVTSHFDGSFWRSFEEKSHFTCIIYLNDGFTSGETTFFPGGKNSNHFIKFTFPKAPSKVRPRAGTALLFRHTGPNSPMHQDSIHHSPKMKKYELRTDIMYKLEPSK